MRIYDSSDRFAKACRRIQIDPLRFRCPICGSSTDLSATAIPRRVDAPYSAHFTCGDCDWSGYEPHLIGKFAQWRDVACASCGRHLASLEIDVSDIDPCRSYLRTGVLIDRPLGTKGHLICPRDGCRTELSNFVYGG